MKKVSKLKRLTVWRRHDAHCYYCHTLMSLWEMSIDHLIPKSKGGTNHVSNLVPCCKPCNGKKANKLNAKIYVGQL